MEEEKLTPVSNHAMQYKKALPALGVVALFVAIFTYGVFVHKKAVPNPEAGTSQAQATTTKQIQTKTTDYNRAIPPRFPEKALLGASESAITQSVGREIGTRLQQDVVISSKNTVKENYTAYQNFMKTDGWKILTEKNDSKLSILVGTKEGLQINVAILAREEHSTSTTLSTIIVSVIHLTP